MLLFQFDAVASVTDRMDVYADSIVGSQFEPVLRDFVQDLRVALAMSQPHLTQDGPQFDHSQTFVPEHPSQTTVATSRPTQTYRGGARVRGSGRPRRARIGRLQDEDLEDDREMQQPEQHHYHAPEDDVYIPLPPHQGPDQTYQVLYFESIIFFLVVQLLSIHYHLL